jgi:hypothetical protein
MSSSHTSRTSTTKRVRYQCECSAADASCSFGVVGRRGCSLTRESSPISRPRTHALAAVENSRHFHNQLPHFQHSHSQHSHSHHSHSPRSSLSTSPLLTSPTLTLTIRTDVHNGPSKTSTSHSWLRRKLRPEINASSDTQTLGFLREVKDDARSVARAQI